ncbi:hypothetical protein SDRG_09250 [Saprolegnia diclina VS20]|uniref:Cytidyltransferase-like domain-containing protein n=1 Tax=Saprolegnia diclina (strain VS20) TaxID=1156394 RepID=T0RLS0_SAPDV|nr:hypothetical protein SDRG_09250 [Saprolegnia diclina VS20]EQC33268.1 hypothetical protein SDRG_09250 [Saprolegnia diclina VS20]|eukprot:XP_008613391.1 hypothetical protein SDRG_09250 [Saprolegnia diclina VS20]
MKQKLPYVGAGLGTVLCGAAAAACVYSLVTIRARPKKLLTESGSPQVPVGLLRLSHPGDEFLHLLRNDVLLEKTIDRVSSRLLIYVETPPGMATSARLQFLSDLYNNVWDLACYVGKYELDIRLVASHDRSWDELLATPEVTGVFGYHGMDVSELNAQRPAHLPRVGFYPLKTYVERLVNPAQFAYLEDPSTTLAKEAVVVVGGTFDHLHNGHKKLLSLAAAVTSSLLIVGVTAPHMLEKKKLGYLIQPLDMRKRKVTEYLACITPSLQADIMTIDDPFGPAISSPQITGIVVSTETVPGAVKINEIRAERGLSPLKIYVCRRTECSTLSSSFIREQIARR